MIKFLNGYPFLVYCLFFFFLLIQPPRLTAGLTLQGPSGYIRVPSHRTIPAKEIDLAVHTRMYKISKGSDDAFLTNMAFGFSPFKDFEIGVQKAIDSRSEANEPDPTINFKVRLPSIGSGEFSEIAFGAVFDTNPNNYHTMYLTLGGVGVGWNFGGNPGSGVANYGGYDREKQEPKSLCLLIGTEFPQSKSGERGYRSRYYMDYDGDVASVGWRYSSHRGFWIDAAVCTKSDYNEEFYDFRPFVLGFGGNF